MSVSVNGFLASCAAADCGFSQDAALTPSLTDVTSAVVSGEVELTITGTGLTADPADYVVTAGELACAVTAASASSITW